MKIILLFISLLSIQALAAAPGNVHSCEGLDSIGMLIGQTKSFTSGETSVKVAYVSTEEPAAAPDHLLVFIYGPEMSIDCFAISEYDRHGYASISMKDLQGKFDSKANLVLSVPVSVSNNGEASVPKGRLMIRVNPKDAKTPVTVLK